LSEEQQKQSSGTELTDKIQQVLTEVRVALPGAQTLMGFQFIALFMEAFQKLPQPLKIIHLYCSVPGRFDDHSINDAGRLLVVFRCVRRSRTFDRRTNTAVPFDYATRSLTGPQEGTKCIGSTKDRKTFFVTFCGAVMERSGDVETPPLAIDLNGSLQ